MTWQWKPTISLIIPPHCQKAQLLHRTRLRKMSLVCPLNSAWGEPRKKSGRFRFISPKMRPGLRRNCLSGKRLNRIRKKTYILSCNFCTHQVFFIFYQRKKVLRSKLRVNSLTFGSFSKSSFFTIFARFPHKPEMATAATRAPGKLYEIMPIMMMPVRYSQGNLWKSLLLAQLLNIENQWVKTNEGLLWLLAQRLKVQWACLLGRTFHLIGSSLWGNG